MIAIAQDDQDNTSIEHTPRAQEAYNGLVCAVNYWIDNIISKQNPAPVLCMDILSCWSLGASMSQ